MKTKPWAASVLCGGLLLLSAGASAAQAPTTQSTASAPVSATDRDTTQKIRKALVGDKSLSTYAHNVKVLVHEGQVTLRGPVRSDTEKKTVADLASSVAGADRVTNELTVEPSK